MINFNELRITPDSKRMIIDVSVSKLSYYTNVYIDSIYIDTQDTYVATGISSNPVYTYKANGNIKTVRLDLDQLDIVPSFTNTLFFVYIVTKGVPDPSTPCGEDNITSLGVIMNLYPFYRNALCGLKELTNNCNIPTYFIDNILKWEGLKLAIKTGHYTEAINYWNKFFKDKRTILPIQNCGCNGTP